MMTYIAAYLKAFFTIFIGFGTGIFVIKLLFFKDFIIDYCFFNVVVAALGGPICVVLNKRKTQ